MSTWQERADAIRTRREVRGDVTWYFGQPCQGFGNTDSPPSPVIDDEWNWVRIPQDHTRRTIGSHPLKVTAPPKDAVWHYAAESRMYGTLYGVDVLYDASKGTLKRIYSPGEKSDVLKLAESVGDTKAGRSVNATRQTVRNWRRSGYDHFASSAA